MFKARRRCGLATVFLVMAFMLGACGNSNDIPASSEPTATEIARAGEPESNSTEADEQESAITKNTPTGEIPTAPPPEDSIYDEDGDGYMTNNEFCQAIGDRVDDYTFPEGYKLNADDLCQRFTAEAPPETKHENGAEFAVIGRPHMCAWGQTWLDAFQQGDNDTMDTAMHELETVTLTNPMFTYVKDDYAQAFSEAKLGDVANLRVWVGPNECDLSIFETTGDVTPESDLVGPPATNHRKNITHLTSFSSHSR